MGSAVVTDASADCQALFLKVDILPSQSCHFPKPETCEIGYLYILKIGLSGIVKRYGYQNVQEFYRIYNKSHSAYVDYREQVANWEKTYGEDNQRGYKESVLERLKNPIQKAENYQQINKDRGAITSPHS